MIPALRIFQPSSKGAVAEHMILGSARQGSKEGGDQSRKQEGAVAVMKGLPEVGLDILLSWYSACRMKVFTPNPSPGEVEAGLSQVQSHSLLHSYCKIA